MLEIGMLIKKKLNYCYNFDVSRYLSIQVGTNCIGVHIFILFIPINDNILENKLT